MPSTRRSGLTPRAAGDTACGMFNRSSTASWPAGRSILRSFMASSVRMKFARALAPGKLIIWIDTVAGRCALAAKAANVRWTLQAPFRHASGTGKRMLACAVDHRFAGSRPYQPSSRTLSASSGLATTSNGMGTDAPKPLETGRRAARPWSRCFPLASSPSDRPARACWIRRCRRPSAHAPSTSTC
jgi:hypothetical protein